MTELTGKTLLGRYRVDKFLGGDGITQNFKVWDEQRQVNLTMKILPESLATDKIFLRRFQHEAQQLAKLQHPNYVKFYSLEQEDRMAFMLTEFVEGESLKLKIFDTGVPFSFRQIREFLHPVIDALRYASKRGVEHGSVSPENIIINQDGQVKLSGLEMTRLREAATTVIGTTGNPAYMSPEQARRMDELAPQADVYALGIILFDLLSGGEHPFTGEHAEISGNATDKVLWEQIFLEPPSLQDLNPDIPPEVEVVVLKCLEKNPIDRFRNPYQFWKTLEDVFEGRVIDDGTFEIDDDLGSNEAVEQLPDKEIVSQKHSKKVALSKTPKRKSVAIGFLGVSLLVIIGVIIAISNSMIIRPGADFSSADLSGRDLHQYDFSDVNLSGADLSATILSGVDLRMTILTGASFYNANLSATNLSGQDLQTVKIERADLSEANLSDANLSGIDLTSVDFEDVILQNADLSGANLTGKNLENIDLNGVNLSGSNLSDAILAGCDLSSVVLNGVNFQDANLIGSKLTNQNFQGSTLNGANLSSSDLTGANLAGFDLRTVGMIRAILRESDLSGAILAGKNIQSLDFEDANLIGANLSKVILTGVDLRSVTLTEAVLVEAILKNTELSGQDLLKVDLTGANLAGANLSGADLSTAILSDAIFTGANLSEANLSGQDLQSVDLSATNLLEADLSASNLTGVDLSSVILDGTTLSGADLSEANLSGLDLRQVDFQDARLVRANLSGANLENVFLLDLDISGANMVSAILIGTNFTGSNLIEANLAAANMKNSIFENTVLDDATLNRAAANNANFQGASMVGVNLLGTSFENANLDNADLSNADGMSPDFLDKLSSWINARIHSEDVILDAFFGICTQREGVLDSAVYTSGSEFYPVIILSENGMAHSWQRSLPDEFKPLAIQSTQLVVCVGEEKELKIETCKYTPPPDIDRYLYQVTVKLVEARTGRTVVIKEIRGNPPRECRQSESISTVRLDGEQVTYGQFETWLMEYIEP